MNKSFSSLREKNSRDIFLKFVLLTLLWGVGLTEKGVFEIFLSDAERSGVI
jgi:hypothetical protein